MFTIALTGGIGCGKTAAANFFADLGVPVIDADKIAHEALLPKTVFYRKAVAYFGNDFLTTDKLIDRKKLRKFIFHHKKERVWLERLLHPHVRAVMQKMQKSLAKNPAKTKVPYCILVIPLFFETTYPIKADRVLVINSPKKLQIKRISKRDAITQKEAAIIIEAQVVGKLRLQRADDVIQNQETLKHLAKEVKKIHNYYLSILNVN